ncbi:MAG: hypothetical protein EBU08_01765 [Micrococcales bacterium]|nr:hypothetical protein [Microbacteriaceae bacterium]NBR22523.1 hypothetical protein [Micrococcales bacterium]NBS60644.1 hypothetical protein [Microbacteriaceae bacterium]NBX94773.1 hypothetical protein [Actinomycetota bacterium]
MIVKELFPGSAEVQIDPKTSSLQVASHWYPRILGIRFNYVINAAGTSAENSDADSNELDRYFLRVIRSSSDLIITTGKTARAERLRSSKIAPMAIITSQPDSLNIPAIEEQSSHPVYVCSEVAPKQPFRNSNAKWLETSSASIAEIVLEVQAKLNSKNPLLEIGIDSLRELASPNLVNELCLTVTNADSRELAVEASEGFLKSAGLVAEQLQLLNSGNTWLFRFRVFQQSS